MHPAAWYGGFGPKHIVVEECNRRTLQISQQNALRSVLLCLPLEILDIIVSYVIGAYGNLIHIKYVGQNNIEDPYRHRLGLPDAPPGFHRSVCKNSETEDDAYAQVKCFSQRTLKREPQGWYIHASDERHYYCDCCDPSILTADTKKLHHAIFSSCRKLYHLANTILYTRNTLSFDDSLSFSQFVAQVDVNQTRMIKSLHLCKPSASIPESISHVSSWNYALEASSIQLLKGLQTVHLCLSMSTPSPDPYTGMSHDYEGLLEADLQPFLRLRILPLTKATVIISDDITQDGDPWSIAKKNEWAEKTRLKLLEPYAEIETSLMGKMKGIPRTLVGAGLGTVVRYLAGEI